MVELVCLMDD